MKNNKNTPDALSNEQITTEPPYKLEKHTNKIDADHCVNANFDARIATKIMFIIVFIIHFFAIKFVSGDSNLTEAIANDFFLELQQMQRFTDLISGGILALLISYGFQQLIGHDTDKSYGIPLYGIMFIRSLGAFTYIMVCLLTNPLNTISKLVIFIVTTFLALILC